MPALIRHDFVCVVFIADAPPGWMVAKAPEGEVVRTVWFSVATEADQQIPVRELLVA